MLEMVRLAGRVPHHLFRHTAHVDARAAQRPVFHDGYPGAVLCRTPGMGYAAAAASWDATSFRKLMDANRWWFVLSQCGDGSFYYQPNRDNAGYGPDARMSASAVTAPCCR